jgi:hypothetical protein
MDENLKAKSRPQTFKTWLSNAVAKDQPSNAEGNSRST